MREMIGRRILLATGAATLAAPAVAQAPWPNRPVRVIIPWPPGGSTDVLARILAEQMQQRLGQPFVVENRAGAGGNIGADAVAKSAPDGYTLGSVTLSAWHINEFLYTRLPYDPRRDFQPISMHWELPNVFVVPTAHVPATTLAEFIAWAREKRGGVSYGSPGVGTTPHLSGAMFASRLNLDTVHVPFRGAAQTIPAMLSGDVNFAVDNLASYVPVIQEGRMRALAVTSAERFPTLPNVPTMAEAGVPDFVVTSWCAWGFPAGVPRPIVDRASEAMRAIAAEPAFQQRFLATGARALGSTPEVVLERVARERPMWQEVVRVSGARLE
jgi:tripartite-type tricarboxylate transporter receptor subunit TctC